MILADTQVKELIEKPAHADMIKRAREIYAEHELHIKGIGVEEALWRIEQYENIEQWQLRKKLTNLPATVPVFSKELQLLNKVFNAQGGSKYYDFGNNTNLEADFKAYLNTEIWDGHTLAQGMRDIWGDRVNTDCTGLVMAELPKYINPLRPAPYVTYKSIMDIHDMQNTGNTIDYVIFRYNRTDKEGKLFFEYRVVDDLLDRIYIQKDGQLYEDTTQQLRNLFGYVPARMMSSQMDGKSNARTSYIWFAMGLAQDYMRDGSIHTITKYLHGFPIFWMRERPCDNCKGMLQILTPLNGTDTLINCPVCKGSGQSIKKDVSDIHIVPTRETNDEPENLPIAGYVQPEIETWKQQILEMNWLRELIRWAIWSTDDNQRTNAQTETATGRILDVQAYHDKLKLISENAQEVETFITNAIAQVRYGQVYRGCSINYGKRYLIRSADEAEATYEAAKKAELPTAVLDCYLEELIYIKFESDPVELKEQLILLHIEPFVHMTIEQVKAAGVSTMDLYMKIYFTDYIERYEREVMPISLADEADIRLKLIEYNTAKVAEITSSQATGKIKSQESLLGTVGFMTELLAYQLAVSSGQLDPEVAAQALSELSGWDMVKCTNIVGKKSSTPPPQPPAGGVPAGPPVA